ncbi:hypothetical protein PM082_012424 [Marasmius tenuissimus]|nr:hypothetical protein PM082_012424 [Marasmius tenuissimus]
MSTGGRAPKKLKPSVELPVSPPDTVIYISSDEDEDWRENSVNKKRRGADDVEGRLKRVKKVLAEEINNHFESLEHGFEAIRLRDLQVEAHLTCGICDEIFIAPHILTACGHVFCKECLHKWFPTILTKYRQEGFYDPNNVLVPKHLRTGLAKARSLQEAQELLRAVEQPKFTCPSCRTPAINSPVEVYPMKALSGMIRDGTNMVQKSHEKESWVEFWGSKR